MVPEGWSSFKLEDLSKKPISYGIVQTGDPVKGGVKCLRVVDITKPTIDLDDLITTTEEISQSYKRTILEQNEIILALRGEIGKSLLVSRELAGCNLTRGLARISPNGETDAEYLFQVLGSPQMNRGFEIRTNGSALREIPIGELRRVPVCLPPLPEQRKIAAILSTWDRAIELTEKLIAAKQKRKQALMQRLLTGKVRFKEFEGKPWKEIKVGKLFRVRNEQIPNDGTHPLYSLTIEDGVTPKSERYDREFLVRDTTSKKYKVVRPGDIVFNPSNLRWGAIGIHNGTEPVLVSPVYEVLYVVDANATNKRFLFQQLSSSRQIQLFAGMAEGTLVERTAVKLPTFLSCKILVPPTLAEQIQVAQVLSAADEEIARISDRKVKLSQQKKGLMQQLLTGKVRVNVDAETVKA